MGVATRTVPPLRSWARKALLLGALLAVVAISGCLGGSKPVSVKDAAAIDVARVDAVCMGAYNGVDLRNASIADLQAALEGGTLTSVELVRAMIARIDGLDRGGPALNSVRHINPQAVEEAARLDAERKTGNVRGPLHGIPIMLKDNIGTFDMPTTAGSIALAANYPLEDSTASARLREAGMIILGKLNLSEFAGWMALYAGYSTIGGQVINAYTGGSPGGSSSGSGVAGSMGFGAITLGSDTMGSIIGPSEMSSLVGMRPTKGLLSGWGVIPLAYQFDSIGPMGRHVHDVALTLGAMVGVDPKDSFTAASDGNFPADGNYAGALTPTALQGARIGFDDRSGNELYLAALDVLRAQGATLEPVTLESSTGTAGATELTIIPNEFKLEINEYLAQQAGPDIPVTTLSDIIAYNNQHMERMKYGQGLLILSDATLGSREQHEATVDAVVAANIAIATAMLEDFDAVVGPGGPYAPISAAAGFPEIVIPIGYNGDTPQGMSFFGPKWTEAKLLGYSYAYEQAAQVRLAPEVINPSLLDGIC